MTRPAERLEVRPVPEPARIPSMLDDMVDLEGDDDLAASSAAVRLVTEDTGA
jgi:hypothetical protein